MIRLPRRGYKPRPGSLRRTKGRSFPPPIGGVWRYFAAACAAGFMPFFWITGTELGSDR
jgi:hypothetical protein